MIYMVIVILYLKVCSSNGRLGKRAMFCMVIVLSKNVLIKIHNIEFKL